MATKAGARRDEAALPGDDRSRFRRIRPTRHPGEQRKEFGADSEYERPAQPVEIAPVFVFLASNEARFVTGEVYGVTGGQMPY